MNLTEAMRRLEEASRGLQEARKTAETAFLAGFGRRVAERRAAAGMTQDELGAGVGLSRPTITQIEAGRQGIPLSAMPVFAAVLKCQPADLIPDDGGERVDEHSDPEKDDKDGQDAGGDTGRPGGDGQGTEGTRVRGPGRGRGGRDKKGAGA